MMHNDATSRVRQFMLIGAILVTGAVLLLQHFSFNKSLTIDPSTAFHMAATDDRPVGGESIARLDRNDDRYQLHCQIDASYQWPFCQLMVEFASAPNGIDLSGYDSVELDVSIEGPGNPSLRVYLRNFNPAYARPNRPTSYKVNEVEYQTENYDGRLTIPLSTFSVPAWWRINNNVDISLSQPEYTRIVLLELATGSIVENGNYTISMRQVTFHGKWLSRQAALIGLLAMWVALAGIALGSDYYRARKRKRFAQYTRRLMDELDTTLGKEESGPNYDPVTGLGTRQYLRKRVLSLLQASQREPATAMLVELDLHCDYHHQDSAQQAEILAQVARLIKQHIRREDIAIRWHTTQFLVICPATTTAQAIEIGETFRHATSEHAWPHEINISLSLGIAQHRRTGLNEFSKILTRALHRARDRGGNQTVALMDDGVGNNS